MILAEVASERIRDMVEISKSDWKLYRDKIGDWQERYMEKLVKEYIKLLSSPGNASDHFWALEERIKKDKKHPGVLIEMNKSDAYWDIALLVKKKVIRMEDLAEFSDDLKDAVALILSR